MVANDSAMHAALASVADPTLRQTLACLLAHHHPKWGDVTPLDVLNRLLAKYLGPPDRTKYTHANVKVSQIQSRSEKWPTAALAALTRGHADPTGTDFDCPIVLAEAHGRTLVLDGNHRINRWALSNDTREHAVNVHVISGAIDFVEREPVNGA